MKKTHDLEDRRSLNSIGKETDNNKNDDQSDEVQDEKSGSEELEETDIEDKDTELNDVNNDKVLKERDEHNSVKEENENTAENHENKDEKENTTRVDVVITATDKNDEEIHLSDDTRKAEESGIPYITVDLAESTKYNSEDEAQYLPVIEKTKSEPELDESNDNNDKGDAPSENAKINNDKSNKDANGSSTVLNKSEISPNEDLSGETSETVADVYHDADKDEDVHVEKEDTVTGIQEQTTEVELGNTNTDKDADENKENGVGQLDLENKDKEESQGIVAKNSETLVEDHNETSSMKDNFPEGEMGEPDRSDDDETQHKDDKHDSSTDDDQPQGSPTVR